MKKFLLVFMFCGHFLFSQNAVLTQLESVAQNNQSSPAAFLNLGQYYFFNGKFADANQQFDKAIALDNDDADFYFFQAVSYEAQGMNEKALDSYDKAITTDEATEYFIRRAYLRYKLKKYIGAAKDFREALETYEEMNDLKKMLQDCEKNGGSADKDAESNAGTAATKPELSATFIEKMVKQFEALGDAGGLYRGMLYLFTNNIDKAIPVFEQFIKKDTDAETMFLNGLAYQAKGKNNESAFNYLLAIQEIDNEITETSFEKLAGYSKADLELVRLKNIRIDYKAMFDKVADKNAMPQLPVNQDDTKIKGEVRAAKSTYTFSYEKQDGNVYQLVVRNKEFKKVMLSNTTVTREGEAFVVKIVWADKKDDSGLTWNNRPQDFFIAHYVPAKKAQHREEGERLKAAKKANLDWQALAELSPKTANINEVLSFAASSFMVGYLIKE
jgi:tetratricopeptide (TPR) repeat protein